MPVTTITSLTVILNFFKHMLGNSNMPVTILLPLFHLLKAAAEGNSLLENSEICPVTFHACHNVTVSAVFLERCSQR